MNEVIAIICLAGYGMIVRDLRIYYSKKKSKPSPHTPPAYLPYPMPIERKRGPWS